jgi:hypothetical protein
MENPVEDDLLVELLHDHLQLAKRQLRLVQKGVRLSLFEEDQLDVIPTTEHGLFLRIAKLEAAIARHQTSQA